MSVERDDRDSQGRERTAAEEGPQPRNAVRCCVRRKLSCGVRYPGHCHDKVSFGLTAAGGAGLLAARAVVALTTASFPEQPGHSGANRRFSRIATQRRPT